MVYIVNSLGDKAGSALKWNQMKFQFLPHWTGFGLIRNEYRLHLVLVLIAGAMVSCFNRGIASSLPSNKRMLNESKLQIAFIKNNMVYYAHRRAKKWYKSPKWPYDIALLALQFYKTTISGHGSPYSQLTSLEFRSNEFVIANEHSFIRWRLSSQMIWGTERSFDDQRAGIFHIPMKEIDSLRDGQNKIQSWWDLEPDESGHPFLDKYTFDGGNTIISCVAGRYWRDRRIFSEKSIDSFCKGRWPNGSSGVYFDFLPTKSNKSIFLFILYEKGFIPSEGYEKRIGALFDEPEDEKKRHRRNVIKIWLCSEEESEDTLKQLIDTDMNEPFYVFERNGHYYFTTLSGKIYIAPLISVDPKKIERLIADLDSGTFTIREKATRDLRALGKPAQEPLAAYVSKSISTEQKRRITHILSELKTLPDRETKLLWQDANRPVDKLLFDQDKNKVYAFTKPNQDKRIHFFEITDKPQPRLFTGKTNPDAPASVPASTRLFLEYARFVRNLK